MLDPQAKQLLAGFIVECTAAGALRERESTRRQLAKKFSSNWPPAAFQSHVDSLCRANSAD